MILALLSLLLPLTLPLQAKPANEEAARPPLDLTPTFGRDNAAFARGTQQNGGIAEVFTAHEIPGK